MIDTGLVYCHVLSKYKSQEFILKDLTRQTLEHILVPPYQALRVIAGPPVSHCRIIVHEIALKNQPNSLGRAECR